MDVEKLISLVFVRKPLWDQSTKEYHNRDVARKLWLEVAEELNESSNNVKARWRGLRDNYRKELVKSSKIHSGSCASKWAYFETMMFLKNSLGKNRNAPCNIQLPQNTEEVDDITLNSYSFLEDDEAYSENESQSQAQLVSERNPNLKLPSSNKNKRSDNVERMTSMENQTIIEVYKETAARYNDTHYQFLVSLLPELKKVPSHRQLHARIKMQQVLLEEQEHQSLQNG